MAEPFVKVELRWRPRTKGVSYPSRSEVGMTAYRKVDGIDGLFSVYVKMLSGSAGPNETQTAKVFALHGPMAERLPKLGEILVLTAGSTPVAEGLVIEVGSE